MAARNLLPGYILAVDLGGTKVAAALVDNSGHITLRRQMPTCQTGPADGIGQMAELLQEIRQASTRSEEIAAVGIGIPAVLEPQSDHVIWAPNLSGWRDVALRPALEKELGLPVFVEYDGHTAVLGEWWQGAGQGYQDCVNIIIGTGIGGGVIMDGRLLRGRDRLAGAAGWFALTTNAVLDDPTGRSIGHWESLAAGPGIARRAAALLAEYPDSLLATAGDQPFDARAVFSAARTGDILAQEIIAETAEIIGLGVANIVSLLNPEIIILGGGVGSQGDLLLPKVRQTMSNWAQPISARSILITSSDLGSDAGLLGAAYTAGSRLLELSN